MRSPYTTRPSIPGCGAPGFPYAHLHAARAVHSIDGSVDHLIERHTPIWMTGILPFEWQAYSPLIDKPTPIQWTSLLPMLKLLLLILLRRFVQILVLQILVIQIMAIQTFVTHMIVATLLRSYAPKSSWSFFSHIAKSRHTAREWSHITISTLCAYFL